MVTTGNTHGLLAVLHDDDIIELSNVIGLEVGADSVGL